MKVTRRGFLGAAGAMGITALSGCTASLGSKSSYISKVVAPQYINGIYYWLDAALQQIRDQRMAPPAAATGLAAPFVAGFLAANAVYGRYDDPYGIGPAPVGANPEVAWGEAFGTCISQTFGTPFIGERSAYMDHYINDESKSLGKKWGRDVGIKILKMRTFAGAAPPAVNHYLGRYPRRQDALKWTPSAPHFSETPGPAFPSFERGVRPGQGQIKPWTMQSPDQFLAPDFPDPRSPEFADMFETVRVMGGENSPIRTADQTEIAIYWEDGPWGITPPGHFLYIAAQVLQGRITDFLDLAHAFALLTMTQADAAINSWHNKYIYDIVRPETVIRHRATSMGNADPRMLLYPKWRSVINTPPFPAYTSGHSTFGAAACTMLAMLLGTDNVSFGHESPDQVIWPQLRGKVRNFTSLSQAAEENGMSRIYGGVHWPADHKGGMMCGQRIAENAYHNFFRRRV